MMQKRKVANLTLQEMIENQKTCLIPLACYPSTMIHHILDSTKECGNGDFMYCHSSMASEKLLQIRKTNILLAEEMKLADISEENMNYFNMPKEVQCEGNVLPKEM